MVKFFAVVLHAIPRNVNSLALKTLRRGLIEDTLALLQDSDGPLVLLHPGAEQAAVSESGDEVITGPVERAIEVPGSALAALPAGQYPLVDSWPQFYQGRSGRFKHAGRRNAE
jgi:hypothetical protein